MIIKESLEEISDLKNELKYAEKRIGVLLEGKTDGYKGLFSRLPTVIPFINEKDDQIKSLQSKIEIYEENREVVD